MRVLSLIAVVGIFGSGAAMACQGSPPPHCHCSGNQWVDDVTNNVYNNTNNNVTNNNNQKTTNVNGVNGNISGGTASSNSVAKGGNAVAKGGNSNSSSNQNQHQSQNAVSNSTVGNVSTGASTATASADGAGTNNGNNSNNTVVEAPKTYRNPVNTAYASSLTSGMDTCLGSVSGGAQTQIFGITIGGTKVDKNCILIKQTALLREMNQDRAACFRMQMHAEGADIKEAMKEAGAECPSNTVATSVQTDTVTHKELDNVVKKVLQK